MRIVGSQRSGVVYKSLFCFALGAMLLALSIPAQAQQPARIPLIGVLSPGTAGVRDAYQQLTQAFREGLRDLGYAEGKNILLEFRYAEGKLERMPDLVAELLQLKPAGIVVSAVPAIRAAKDATKTIPIVMISTVDPVAGGIVDSLAQPGGNITGLALLTRDLSAKRLELLTEVLQKTSRLAVLWDADGPGPKIAFEEYKATAPSMKLQLQSLEVRGPTPDFDATFKAVAKRHAQALLVIRNPLLARYSKQIATLAIKNRLPSMCEEEQYVEAGCVMSYAASDSDRWRRAATYVDKILKGVKPADLPVEQPMKFEFVINLKTAKQIGLTIPPNVLARADKVIK
jgi:putative ABC transport system substrate-binding protein